MRTLNNIILEAKQEYSKNILIKTAERELTYEEVITNALSWSKYLRKKGIRKGDRIGMITPKTPLQIQGFYGIWLSGGISLPINEGAQDEELGFILGDATPKIILTTKELKERVEGLYPDGEVLILEEVEKEIQEGDYEGLEYEEPKYEETNIATLIYTSGSTGNPKGVMLTHKNLTSNGRAVREEKKLSEETILYSILPYWHIFSLTVEVITPLLSGGSVCFTKNQRTFVQDIARFNPTHILAVPRILELLRNGIEKQVKLAGKEGQAGFARLLEIAPLIYGDDSSHEAKEEYQGIYKMLDEKILTPMKGLFGAQLKEIISGGAALDEGLQRFFWYIGVPLVQGYGLTEVSPVVSVDAVDTYNFGSIGGPLPWLTSEGGDFTFEDEEGNRGKDIEGELLLKGSCVMKGYWNHKDASAKVIKDSWLATGDIGYYNGKQLFISGRKSNMIVLKGGENVHPEPVENELKKSPLIQDVMVFGDKCKNLHACIVTTEECNEMDEDEVKKEIKKEMKKLSQRLVSYQRPKDFLLVPQFTIEDGTYTGTLKIRRHIIKEKNKESIDKFLKKHGER